ncbi:MAG: hypothetical protein L3J67_02700 [Hyphomicrobiaceae bacterium]|nr:hypothetical protein [Hyphomicrobiaceae bacterium]
MAKRKRPNRSRDMDEALFEALKTQVPPKDTGPDPDDILAGLFEDELKGKEHRGDGVGSLAAEAMVFSVELDAVGLARAQEIVDLIKTQTGEQVDIADALKIALFCDPLEVEKAIEAFLKVVQPAKIENNGLWREFDPD